MQQMAEYVVRNKKAIYSNHYSYYFYIFDLVNNSRERSVDSLTCMFLLPPPPAQGGRRRVAGASSESLLSPVGAAVPVTEPILDLELEVGTDTEPP